MQGLETGAAPAAPVAIPGVSPEGDDLTRIKGIGDDTAKRLAACGVTTYRQLADLNITDCERLEEETGLKGRITNFFWRDQARKIVNEPSLSLPPRLRPSRAAAQVEMLSEVPNDDDPEESEIIEAEEEAPPPLSAPPPSSNLTAEQQILQLRQQLEDVQRQMARRLASTGTRRSRVVPMAEERPMRRRLNENRKYSDILGVDPQVPPGTLYQQVVTEDDEKRVAYFAGDFIQRYLSDEDADDIDFDNVEPPHEVTIDTVNARHYLNGRATYPFPLMQAFMKERFSFEARHVKDIKEELHRMINTNRS